MSNLQRQMSREPATRFAHLRKKMQQARIQLKQQTRTSTKS